MMETITSKRLKEIKGELSYVKLGRKVEVGATTLHNYAHGRAIPSDVLTKICIATHTDANWVLGLTNKKDSNVALKLNMAIMEVRATVNDLATLLKNLEVK